MTRRLLSLSLGLLFACAQPAKAAVSFIDQVLGDNPIGFWILDDTPETITTAIDSSVNDFNGTYGSGVTPQGIVGPSWVPGSVLVADFSGNLNGNITFPTPLNLGANQFTIEAWIRPTLASLQTTSRIVSSGRGLEGYGFGTAAGGELLFTSYSRQDYFSTSLNLLPNQWQYVGIVLDANNDANFYVNGVLVETVDGALTTEAPLQEFTIGSRSPLADEYFSGGIAGISVYNTALTPAQIEAQYNAALIPEPSSLALIGLAFWAACTLRHRRS